jgi:pyruvate/2-oxoglutarate dehydrogenase complex dihydrolipoamide acyltransferase (E2) component
MSSIRVDPAILGEDDDAELTSWLAADGATVEADQIVAEITAAKVVTEVPAPAAGRLRHLAQEGSPLSPGQEIAVIESAD